VALGRCSRALSADPETGIFSHPQLIEGDPDGGLLATVFALEEDANGDLWIGTFLNGQRRLTPETREWLTFTKGDQPGELPTGRINTLLADRAARLWLGTPSGLYRLREDGRFQSYRETGGLTGDTVISLTEGPDGMIWVGTTNGLTRLDPETGDMRGFGSRDGLPHDMLSWHPLATRANGELVIGTTNGFAILDPGTLAENPIPPTPSLLDLQLFNRSVPIRAPGAEIREDTFALDQSILLTAALTLSHRQSMATLSFTGFHYADPTRNRFAYQLTPWDEGWLETDARRRSATYTNLPEGRYTFRLKVANKDGIWSEPEDFLDLRILPPPWGTWWAYTLYTIAVLGILFWAAWSLHRRAVLARRRADREQEINRRLRRLDKLKDEFLANTSHELRTPLNGIVGIAESLVDGAAGVLSTAARKNLSLIVSSGRRLANLVNDILDFSKLRERSLTIRAEPVDVKTLVDVVLDLHRPVSSAKEIALENAVPPNLPAARADEDRLQQIMHNLVGNAIKLTEAGRVRVSARVHEDRLEIAVEDSGIGIPAEKRESIFASFEQVAGEIEREHGGTGLGLAITRKLVALHGGTITVTSEPGIGSIFRFDLPAAGEASTAPAGESPALVSRTLPMIDREEVTPSPEEASVDGNGFRVLVVDDEPVNRQVLVNHLSLRNYEIEEAADGAEALAKIGARRPDLVLLDIMMPRLSGYDVCRQLRQNAAASDLPVIFLSAKNQVSDLVAGFQSGANDYLAKPVAKPELLARVKTHLELLAINRDLEEKVASRTAEVAQRNHELAHRNKQIQAGIEYARLIQRSVLPADETMGEILPEHFVLFAPRESVSGDFYWLHRHADGAVMVAVVDCTGHGVPGALMSMIGTVLLDQLVIQEGHAEPAEILTLLHEEVRKALHQDREDGAANDGMDMVLCRLDPDGAVVFAGARNDALMWHAGERRVSRVRGDKRGIGGKQRAKKRGGFTNHALTLGSGDMLYLMTDGLIDQAGADGKRLGSKRLTAMLDAIAEEPASDQLARLESIREELLRSQSQRDDMTILGIRIP